MGLGKTLLSLELINYYLTIDPNQLFLILAPTDEVVIGWKDEIEKWVPHLSNSILIGSRDEKWSLLDNADQGVVIGTYIGIATMVSELVPIKNKKKREWQPNTMLVDKFVNKLDGVVYDESTRVGNNQSLSYTVANAISRAVPIRYALAGRPFGRDPINLWPQFNLVDRGDTLGQTLGLYREAFFIKQQSYWGGPYNFEYKFKKNMTDDLARLTAHRSICYTSDECQKLPDLIKVVKRVNFPPENEVYYQQVIKKMIEAKGNLREIKSTFLRLRQVSSGFLGLIDEEDDERVELQLEKNPKLDLLLELVEEIPDDKKCVIFHDFNHSGSLIYQALTERKIKCGRLYGETKDWEETKRKFNNHKDFRFLIINSRKGAYGLNLQAASYCIFFENPLSIIDREQAEKRIHRTGQKHTCFIYDLVMRDTVDELILQHQKDGTDLYKAVSQNPQIVLSH